MKKPVFLLLVLLQFAAFSQEDAWVYFNAKPNAQAFFDNPLSELKQRSLDRRMLQNIALDIKDAPIHQPYIDQISAASGIAVLAKSKWLNCLHVRGTFEAINALLGFSFVDRVRFADNALNLRTSTPKRFQPVNKQMDTETTFNYGNSFNQIHMLNGDLLHQQNFTATGKVIAVLDAGFPNVNTLLPFQRLRDNNQILGGYDYVSKDSLVYTGDTHGTMVLSTMGGFKDGQLVGTAPDAQYYLFITEDVASENPVEESNWVEAAESADRVGADVITSSLGYFSFDNPNYGHAYSDMTGNAAFGSQGANIAFSRGMVVVASAGNEGATTEPHVGVPAEATNVLAIGAVKANRLYATFSSVGPTFDDRIKPDIMAQGQASVLVNPSTGAITTANGTSFSGPIMAGMIATFWGAVPGLTNQQVVDFVKQSSDKFANPNMQYGYGIPDFQLALNNALLLTESFSNSKVVVYPNPAKESVSVAFLKTFQNAEITLYNSLGQHVLNQDLANDNTKVSLEKLSSGVYWYKIDSNNFSQTGKIIKQ
ncbi:MAG: S8 family serine peptidase [Burkholderiales bacterium]|nr:S8 family serine peptidase [Flavobacterium sp.]